MSAVRKSHKQDSRPTGETGQEDNPGNGTGVSHFGDRLTLALEGRVVAEVAREAGLPKQTLDGYKKGAIPSADRALALADVLRVEFRWLIAGLGPQKVDSAPPVDSVILPKFDPFAFGEYGKGPSIADVSIPRWLLGTVKQTAELWLCEMPSGALPDVAAEGEMIVCRDPDFPLQDRRVYIFIIDGRPVVRRLWVRSDGLQLTGETDTDTIFFKPEDADNIVPIGRVLASISLNQV